MLVILLISIFALPCYAVDSGSSYTDGQEQDYYTVSSQAVSETTDPNNMSQEPISIVQRADDNSMQNNRNIANLITKDLPIINQNEEADSDYKQVPMRIQAKIEGQRQKAFEEGQKHITQVHRQSSRGRYNKYPINPSDDSMSRDRKEYLVKKRKSEIQTKYHQHSLMKRPRLTDVRAQLSTMAMPRFNNNQLENSSMQVTDDISDLEKSESE